MRRATLVLTLAAAAALPASAVAAPAVLPAKKRTLSAKSGGCATTAYRAPMSGFVSVRFAGARGDWDLALYRGSRRVSRSAGFGARELTQAWVAAGERLTVKGCRHKGASRKAGVRIRFVDAELPEGGTPSLVRVDSPGPGLLHFLEQKGFDVTHNMRQGWADVVLPNAEAVETLKKFDIRYTVRIADLNKQFAKDRRADALYAKRIPWSPLPTGRTSYRLPDEYQTELKRIVDRYPSIARPVTIGQSFQGRDIQGVEIGENVNGTDGRPVYFVMGAHHAREWPSAEIAMEFAWLLVKGYGRDERITDLLKRERVTLVPIINPDGFFASRMTAEDGMFPSPADSTGAPQGGTVEGVVMPFGGNMAYRRKNCNGPFPSFEGERDYPCYYQWGVDPNRNYGQFWGGPGSSPDPNTQVHRGAGQWSEPETQAVHEYSQSRPVTALISLHNVAALVLRPPGLKSQGLAPDENMLREIGDKMADVTGYTSQYGWQLYDTTGTTEDWNYQAAGTLGYTVEIGPVNGQFHMPYETGVVQEWLGPNNAGGMKEALLIGAEAAADPVGHSVIEGSSTPGRVLRVKKTFDTPTSAICTWSQGYVRAGTVPPADCIAPGETRDFADSLEYTTTVPESGRYEWHVTPSSRPFVSGKYIPGAPIDKTDTYEPAAGEEPNAETNSVERTFTVAADEPLTQMNLKLDWTAKTQDYDLNLWHIQPDGSRKGIGTAHFVRGVLIWTAPGQGQNPAGMAEEIDVTQAPPGTYVAEVVYTDSAVANDWVLTVHRIGQYHGVREPTGKTEAWTMTCETPDGQVLESRDVVVDRGERVNVDICAAASSDPGAQSVLGVKRAKLRNLRISRRTVKLTRSGYALVRVYCLKRATAPCNGVLKLRTQKRYRSKGRKRLQFVKLGEKAFSVAPGRAKVVRVKVTPAAREFVRRRRAGVKVIAFAVAREGRGEAIAVKRLTRVVAARR